MKFNKVFFVLKKKGENLNFTVKLIQFLDIDPEIMMNKSFKWLLLNRENKFIQYLLIWESGTHI